MRARAATSAAWPLPVPPVSMRRPGGRVIVPRAVVDVDLAPAPCGVGPSGTGGREPGARLRPRDAPRGVPGVHVPGVLELVEERRVDEPVGAARRLQRGPDGVAQQRLRPERSRGSALSALSSESGRKRERRAS